MSAVLDSPVADLIVLDESMLDDSPECQMNSHQCAVEVTHAIVTSCGHNIPVCVNGAKIQSWRIVKPGNNVCGHCGAQLRHCWSVIKI